MSVVAAYWRLSSISYSWSTHGNSVGAGYFLVALCCAWEQSECSNISYSSSSHGNSVGAGYFPVAVCCAWEQWDEWAFSLTCWNTGTESVVACATRNMAVPMLILLCLVYLPNICVHWSCVFKLGYCVIRMGDIPCIVDRLLLAAWLFTVLFLPNVGACSSGCPHSCTSSFFSLSTVVFVPRSWVVYNIGL